MSDRDPGPDDQIGKRETDAAKLKLDGEAILKNFSFGEKNGTLEVRLQKQRNKKESKKYFFTFFQEFIPYQLAGLRASHLEKLRTYPDFRYSFGLCPQEREFRKRRIPKVLQAMRKILGIDEGPHDELETPILSLVGSGGGYRAMTGMCGAMEALNDTGLLDTVTYNCGLSGSAWYLSAAYALEGITSSEQKRFHDGIKERLDDSHWSKLLELHETFSDYVKMVETSNISRCKGDKETTIQDVFSGERNEVEEFLNKNDLPKSLVNFFPGYMVGKQIFGQDKLDLKLQDLANYVETGDVPYPLMIALQVKDQTSAHKYHAYVERSPHEIYIPEFGIGLKPCDEGSIWSNGVLTRTGPEYPLHFTVGMTGCAFAILLSHYCKYGGESGNMLANYANFDHLRRKAKPKKHKASNPIDGVSDVTLSTARPRRPRCRFYDKTDQGHPQSESDTDSDDSSDSESDSDSDDEQSDDEFSSICSRPACKNL